MGSERTTTLTRLLIVSTLLAGACSSAADDVDEIGSPSSAETTDDDGREAVGAGATTATTNQTPTTGALPASGAGCQALLAAFADRPEANARCEDDGLLFDGNGLGAIDPVHPELRMMVGITAWILRVPTPYDYRWWIPTDPVWLDEFAEASPRGPIAVAVDGVPIFHYEARPDVSTHPEHYDARTDTVVQGELDHCGGHAGQGDDYHYHYAPVCLTEDHDLSEPIAFALDGAPVYYGTGGTDYYGFGYYNDLDLLPDEPLDDCNAVQLTDGSWVHYTTAEPPYVIGCHHGLVDPSLQIEPQPMREQRSAAPYGGIVGEPSQTLVTDLYVDDEGWTHLEHTSFDGSGTSATLYRPADGDDCWEFDFRADAEVPGVIETYCRGQ